MARYRARSTRNSHVYIWLSGLAACCKRRIRKLYYVSKYGGRGQKFGFFLAMEHSVNSKTFIRLRLRSQPKQLAPIFAFYPTFLQLLRQLYNLILQRVAKRQLFTPKAIRGLIVLQKGKNVVKVSLLSQKLKYRRIPIVRSICEGVVGSGKGQFQSVGGLQG